MNSEEKETQQNTDCNLFPIPILFSQLKQTLIGEIGLNGEAHLYALLSIIHWDE